MLNLFPTWDDRVQELIKLRAMIMIFQMTQLVGNNIVNTLFRCSDQICIEGYYGIPCLAPVFWAPVFFKSYNSLNLTAHTFELLNKSCYFLEDSLFFRKILRV